MKAILHQLGPHFPSEGTKALSAVAQSLTSFLPSLRIFRGKVDDANDFFSVCAYIIFFLPETVGSCQLLKNIEPLVISYKECRLNINPNSHWGVHMGISLKERQITEEPMKVKI
jgi:hypothetical protein